jgi:hypothetical protein
MKLKDKETIKIKWTHIEDHERLQNIVSRLKVIIILKILCISRA